MNWSIFSQFCRWVFTRHNILFLVFYSVADLCHFGVDPDPDLDPRIHASDYWIRIRIQEAQKHVDPDSDPDPQHWTFLPAVTELGLSRVFRSVT